MLRTRWLFFDQSILRALAQTFWWAQAYFVSVTNKPQDSVKLYQHRLRVDQSFVTLLQEVIATVEAIRQQRSTASDD